MFRRRGGSCSACSTRQRGPASSGKTGRAVSSVGESLGRAAEAVWMRACEAVHNSLYSTRRRPNSGRRLGERGLCPPRKPLTATTMASQGVRAQISGVCCGAHEAHRPRGVAGRYSRAQTAIVHSGQSHAAQGGIHTDSTAHARTRWPPHAVDNAVGRGAGA